MEANLPNNIIEQLLPYFLTQDFEDKFAHVTAQQPEYICFLIKMELQRCYTPCDIAIDLRQQTNQPCEAITFKEQQHFLDVESKASFYELLKTFQNNFTLGVYEQVHQRFENIKLSQELEASPDAMTKVPSIAFDKAFNATENIPESAIQALLEQGELLACKAIIVNLTDDRVKLRLPPQIHLDPEQTITIKFLNQKKVFDEFIASIKYQLVSSKQQGQFIHVELNRQDDTQPPRSLLQQLEDQQAHLTEQDITALSAATLSKGLERLYFPLIPHLPLFITKKYQEPVVTHMLRMTGNYRLIRYFNDENDKNQLSAMLSHRRLGLMLTHPQASEHRTFFCFTHITKGHTYYYSATLAELRAKNLTDLFLSFGSAKISWRVFEIAIHDINNNEYNKLLSLPSEDDDYSLLTMQQLKRMSHMLTLTDITSSHANTEYQNWQGEQNVMELKTFCQFKIRRQTIKQILLQYREQRSESRYAFKTLVKLTQGNLHCDAISQNISVSGIQLKLDKPVYYDKHIPIYLALPKLQQLAGQLKLDKLPYKLIKAANNGTILQLKACLPHDTHAGVEFLRRLIRHNQQKLTELSTLSPEGQELANALKDILKRKLTSLPFFVSHTNTGLVPIAVGVSQQQNKIFSMLNSNKEQSFNLQNLFKNKLCQKIITHSHQSHCKNSLRYCELFVCINKQDDDTLKYICLTPQQIGRHMAQVQFIIDSQQKGLFLAFRLSYTPTPKLDLNFINQELTLIKIHDSDQGHKIEQQLWQIQGVGELLNITQEVKMRYPELSPKQSTN